MTAARSRWAKAGAAVAAVGMLVTGCGDGGFAGLYSTPLPGGADVGDHPYRLRAQFADVLDLVPQAAVKVNDVAVGRVERVELSPDTRSATVHLVVNGDVELPANADADLRQSSLLGEKFVELRPPVADRPRGRLGDGALIPLARTTRHPELEEVFGALSVLLSGGGIDQLRTIARELNQAFSGNEDEIKALLSRLDRLVGGLDAQKGEIVRAIDGLDRLSRSLVAEQGDLETALADLAPGLRVVAEQTDEIGELLRSLRTLSDVTVDTVGRSRQQLVANLRALEPTLRRLADAGGDLPEALKILPTYPLPYNAGGTMKGDFANVDARFNMNLDTLLANQRNSGQPLLPSPSGPAGRGAPDPVLPLPALPAPPLELPGIGAPTDTSGAAGVFDYLWGWGR